MGLGTYDVDPFDEFDTYTTEYTLKVYKLPRPSSRSSKYEDFTKGDLDPTEMTTVKILSRDFPAEMRCSHIRKALTCDEGCYVLEKGGGRLDRTCSRKGCQGHAYCGNVAMNNDSVACFGKKGQRMVCIDEANTWVLKDK